jgi:hypothetical protein
MASGMSQVSAVIADPEPPTAAIRALFDAD